MAFDPKKMRILFAASTVALLLLVAAIYAVNRTRSKSVLNTTNPTPLDRAIQTASNGFQFTKSTGGVTQFTISAKKTVQYKDGQRASLSDVRIIIYGVEGEAGGYDQIWGKQFDYDPQNGDVVSKELVNIVLAAQGKPDVDPENVGKGSMRMSAKGINFNKNTGLAHSEHGIEFDLPQGKGSAESADYDSKSHTITLQRNVRLAAKDLSDVTKKSQLKGAVILASRAVVTDKPREAVLSDVSLEAGDRKVEAAHATLQIRMDKTLQRIIATGDVKMHVKGKSPVEASAQQVELNFGIYSELLNAVVDHGLQFQVGGSKTMNGNAGRAEFVFGQKDALQAIHTSDKVKLEMNSVNSAKLGNSANSAPMKVMAEAVDFMLRANNELERAVTLGPAQLTTTSIVSGANTSVPSQTIITADKFTAIFAAHNSLKSLTGTPNAKTLTSTPGRPDRITTSREMFVEFDPVRNGNISKATQTGDFQYQEGTLAAWAAKGQYNAEDESFLLTGNPRVEDSGNGLAMTADSIRMDRKTGDGRADGNVKSSYHAVGKSQNNNGVLLGDEKEPVHVTAASMAYTRVTDVAKYSGAARLWQGTTQIRGSAITFDRANKSLQASENASDKSAIHTAFMQTDKNGKTTQINITSSSFQYQDLDRTAHFGGGVKLQSSESTLRADQVDVVLKQKANVNGTTSNEVSTKGTGQIDTITAQGSVHLEEIQKSRKGDGEKLVYTTNDGKYVLTGTSTTPPSIFDAEHGQITGVSLTFFSHDDRVQINGIENTRVVTHTTVKANEKP